MLNTVLYSVIYIIAELFPLSGDAHIKLFEYYFSKPSIDDFTYNIISLSLISGILIFFIKDIFIILKESLKAMNNLRTGRSSFETVVSEYKLFNVFVFIVFISLVNFITFNYLDFIFSIKPDNYLLSFLLIICAAVLFVSRYFTIVKVFPFLFNIKELVFFGILSFISIIPGLSRIALMLGFANIFGFEKKYAYRFSLFSLLIYLIFVLYFKINFSFFFLIFESSYLLVYFFNVILVLFILKIFYYIISNVRVSRFYIYLLVLGLWTILDLYFSKRGL